MVRLGTRLREGELGDEGIMVVSASGSGISRQDPRCRLHTQTDRGGRERETERSEG